MSLTVPPIESGSPNSLADAAWAEMAGFGVLPVEARAQVEQAILQLREAWRIRECGSAPRIQRRAYQQYRGGATKLLQKAELLRPRDLKVGAQADFIWEISEYADSCARAIPPGRRGPKNGDLLLTFVSELGVVLEHYAGESITSSSKKHKNGFDCIRFIEAACRAAIGQTRGLQWAKRKVVAARGRAIKPPSSSAGQARTGQYIGLDLRIRVGIDDLPGALLRLEIKLNERGEPVSCLQVKSSSDVPT